ncbi:SIR2 family protein [Vibrio alginolyticus]|uniref:SIR2 family protein n=1 Tax=Vibrio alginolyticus TaxID=663 RepID=UPI001BD2A7B7|nr:SIR2 family protein [Vibrio alginolyticus]EJE8154278.1 SIR2 family protein [Vibrio alginolyticus]MBS9975565.1 SIR2 family protein [Vibrio alginolyticus]MBT0021383.1 SIR2 family protein [Vibrio alginolyticus]
MEFEEVLSRLYNEGTRGRFMTESFLLHLLKLHVESQGKKIIIESGPTQSMFDALAPDGFDDFELPTYIEITSGLSLKKLIWQLDKYISRSKISNEKSALLILSMRPLSKNIVSEINDNVVDFKMPIYIWGPDEIEKIAAKHSDEVRRLGENLFSLRLESAIKKEQGNWKSARSRIVDDVKDAYKSGQFSLFLGAGVSSSAGLPDWDTLLNSLFVSMLTSEMNENEDKNKKRDTSEISSIVKRLREVDGPSALMSARYIRKGMSTSGSAEQTRFVNTVTEQLYLLRDKRRSLDSPLIKSIAAMCMPSRTGARVKSVVTYNFDDLVERELSKREITYKSIFEEIDLPSPEELPLYHVHGYLPQDRSQYTNLDKSTLVFSEEGYHKIYNDFYHWSNLVQLNSLKESICVMIGLSMTDPNLRRLLEIASRSIEKPKHYAFLKRISIEEFATDNSKKLVNAPLVTIKTFLDRHHSLNEEVLKELGVNIIWYEDYDDIPKIINEITKSI